MRSELEQQAGRAQPLQLRKHASSRRAVSCVILLVGSCLLLSGCLNSWLNRAPLAELWIPSVAIGYAPLDVVFDVSQSRDPDGTVASFVLDFGDGSAASQGTTEDLETAIPHTYTSAGSYAARLTVTDDEGKSDSIALAILVLEPKE
jgi:hypothetical protein